MRAASDVSCAPDRRSGRARSVRCWSCTSRCARKCAAGSDRHTCRWPACPARRGRCGCAGAAASRRQPVGPPACANVAASRQATAAVSAAAGPVSSAARPGGQPAPRRAAPGAQAGPAAAAAAAHAAAAAPGVPRQPQRRAVYGLQRPNQLLRLLSPATPGASNRGNASAPAAPVTFGQSAPRAAAPSAPKPTPALYVANGRRGASRGRARGGVSLAGGRGRAGRGVEARSGQGRAARQDSSWHRPLVGRVVKASGLPAAAAHGRGRSIARRAANGRQVHTLRRVVLSYGNPSLQPCSLMGASRRRCCYTSALRAG